MRRGLGGESWAGGREQQVSLRVFRWIAVFADRDHLLCVEPPGRAARARDVEYVAYGAVQQDADVRVSQELRVECQRAAVLSVRALRSGSPRFHAFSSAVLPAFGAARSRVAAARDRGRSDSVPSVRSVG